MVSMSEGSIPTSQKNNKTKISLFYFIDSGLFEFLFKKKLWIKNVVQW